MGSVLRPAFARDFPRLPELDALVEAFARGDYARVRQDAPKLAERSADENVKRAALTLVERTRADPIALGLFAVTAGLLIVVATWWIVHGHPPPQVPSAPPVERVR
jgi:hypothetical protein